MTGDVGTRKPLLVHRSAQPRSDTAPWTSRHDWRFGPVTLTSNPPQYRGRCLRCGTTRQGWASVFPTDGCPGRVETGE